jgi:protoheme IX farnesyltransferase
LDNSTKINNGIFLSKQEYSKLTGFFYLTKPRLTLLSVITSLFGYSVALNKSFLWSDLVILFVGAYLIGGACGALNMNAEHEHDSLMNRTKGRPIPGGKISPTQAVAFGYTLWLLGVLIFILKFNLLSAIIGSLTVFTYVWIYTPLKRKSTFNTLFGCLPGALPIALGWTASNVQFNIEALILFGILFLWQMPHFLSLAWVYRIDYNKAGYAMLPSVDPTGKKTSYQILFYTIALSITSFAPSLLKFNGKIYLIISIFLSMIFVILSIAFYKERTNISAQKLFRFSLLYLPLIYIALLFDMI